MAPFSSKGKSPKQAVALQILGYSVLSLLSENLETQPEAHIHTFKDSDNPLQGIVESVEICPTLWALCSEDAPKAAEVMPALLALDESTKTQEDFDRISEEILADLREVAAPYQIIDELLEGERLADDRIEALVALLIHKASPVAPTKRSQTLRVKGRRALTPVRRKRKNTSQ